MNADALKKADDIAQALRSYASDCSDDDACFQCTFAWICNKLDGCAPKIIAALIDRLTAQLADYPHMDQLVNGKMAENQRLRQINEKLQSQLAASQRREKAAVEDIMCRDHCDVCVSGKEHEGECKIADYDCLTCKSETCMCNKCRDEDHWIWRGPQEAGEGKAE